MPPVFATVHSSNVLLFYLFTNLQGITFSLTNVQCEICSQAGSEKFRLKMERRQHSMIQKPLKFLTGI